MRNKEMFPVTKMDNTYHLTNPPLYGMDRDQVLDLIANLAEAVGLEIPDLTEGVAAEEGDASKCEAFRVLLGHIKGRTDIPSYTPRDNFQGTAYNWTRHVISCIRQVDLDDETLSLLVKAEASLQKEFGPKTAQPQAQESRADGQTTEG